MSTGLENTARRGRTLAVLSGGFLFLAFTFLMAISTPASAQGNPTATAIDPTVNPTIVAFESVIATQQVQIDELKRNQSYEIRDREYEIRDLKWKWGIAAALGGAAILIASWFGISGLKDLRTKLEETKANWKSNVERLEKEWERNSQRLLDKAIYRLDPGNLPIKLPAGATPLHQLLTRREIGKIEFYNSLDDLTHEDLGGVIVVSMTEKEQLATMEDKFRQFVQRTKPDPALTGIVLYTGPNRVSDETTMLFDNLVTANYPGTVVSNIFVVGRALKIEPRST